jgi:glycosyltransferase involved in cell wall biosynthesis
LSDLDDVLVVCVRKSFWSSPEAEIFPRRIYTRIFYGHSTNLLNSAFVALRGLFAVWMRRPRVVLLGAVERTVPWFIRARQYGLLRGAKLVLINQLSLTAEQLEHVDRVIVHATEFTRRPGPLRERAVFVPIPADGDFARAAKEATQRDVVFTGGMEGRDFRSVIEAVRGEDVPLELITFSPETLGFDGEVPPNVDVHWRMPVWDFLARMASSLFVVVPLRSADSPHGQMFTVQALALGKPVIATRSPGVDDYLTDGREGFLVDVGDVAGYRKAILTLLRDVELRERFAREALARTEERSYPSYAQHLRALCLELLAA